jgi:hypothetical protein
MPHIISFIFDLNKNIFKTLKSEIKYCHSMFLVQWRSDFESVEYDTSHVS